MRLPTDVEILGQLVENAQQEIVGVTAVVPEKPVDLVLPSFSLTVDSEEGIFVRLDNDQLIDMPCAGLWQDGSFAHKRPD